MSQLWFTTTTRLAADGGRYFITRVANASSSKCDNRSRPFSWRFPAEFTLDIMTGNCTWIKKNLPSYKRRAKRINDPQVNNQLEGKINKLRKYGYVALWIVKSVLYVFTVPAVYDVRPFYNGASSGLNEVIQHLWFGLPTVQSELRAIKPGTFMGDADVSEMFHNCVLEDELQLYVGVEFNQFHFDPNDLKELETLLSTTTQGK